MASGAADRMDAEKARMLARRKAVVAAEKEAKAAEKVSKMSAKDLANQEAINRAKELGAEQDALSLSYTEQLQILKRQEMIDSGEHVKATKKLLDIKQKQILQQATIDAKFDKFKDTWDDFFSTATDPKIAKGLFLVAAADKALEMGESLLDAQKSMGISYTQGIKMAGSLSYAAGSGLLLGIGLKDTLAAAEALTEVMGDLNEKTSTSIKTVARLSKKYGIAGTEAAGLYKQIKLMSGGTDEMAVSQLQYTEDLARVNDVAPGKVVGDMAKNSEFMAKFMGKNSNLMAETAVQAAKLGIEMSDIASMMDSILDIETSIEKEMQVSVLLGRQISFDKARQLAMAGKTKEATREILNQVGGIAEFEKMSVIQRKALAEAAGVDLATMQSMVGNRQKQIEMGMVEASTMEKIYEVGIGIGTTIKDNMALAAASTNMLANLQVLGALGWIKEKAHMIWRRVFSKKSHMDRMRQLVKERAAKRAAAAEDAANAGASSLGGSKGPKVSSLGVSKLGKNMGNILKGAAAMVLVAGAVFIFGKALQEMKGIGLNEVLAAAASVAIMMGAMVLIGLMMKGPLGAMMLTGAFAMLTIAAAVYVLGKALQEMATGFDMMSDMTTKLTELVEIAPQMLLAAAGFIAMGYGLVALSAGLLLLAPMLPIILALGGLAAVGMNLMGGGEGDKDDSSNVIAEKLDILIDLMKQPGVVKMDGKVVGEVIALARGPMGT
jgi:hypothetical protein